MDFNLFPPQSLQPILGALSAHELMLGWRPTGSFYTCDPPVTNTDVDFLIQLKSSTTWQTFKEFEALLIADGWVRGGSAEQDISGSFASYKKLTTNLIITYSDIYAKKYILATEVCKTLNLLEKKDRILVFQAIVNGVYQHGK